MITDAIRKATDQYGLPRMMPDCIRCYSGVQSVNVRPGHYRGCQYLYTFDDSFYQCLLSSISLNPKVLTAEPAGTLTLGLYDIDKTTEVTSAAVGDKVVIKGTFARTGTVKPVLSGHSKIEKNKDLNDNW